MKLSTVALSLIAVIGVATVGGSYFTGKMAEEKYTSLVQQSNNQLKKIQAGYGIDLQIENVKFERGFFDSKVDYQLVLKADDNTTYTFNGKDTLFHGPFPLNRLKHGNLVPALASWEGEITVPDAFKSAIQNADGVLGKDRGVISYSGETEGGFSLNPVKYANESGEIELTGLDFNVSTNKDFDLALPYFKFTSKTENVVFATEGLNYHADVESLKDYPNYQLTTAKGTLKSFIFTSTDPKERFDFALNDVTLDSKDTLDKDRITSEGSITSHAELRNEYGKADLGKFGVSGSFKLDAAALNNLAEQLSEGKSLNNPEMLWAYYQPLFEKDVDIKFNYLLAETEKGKATIDLISNTKGFNPAQLRNLNDVLNLFKQSSLSMKADIANIEELSKRIATIAEDKAADPEAAAKEIVNMILDNSRTTDAIKVTDKDISFNLDIDQGKVKLNGKELSENEVQNILMYIVFAAASMGM